MASVSIKRGTKEEIDATNVNDGQILFTTDQAQNKIYADVGEVRKQIGGTVEVIDNLTSNDTDKALSANMGKTLSNSSNISYSNSTSGLSATNVQEGIDELVTPQYMYLSGYIITKIGKICIIDIDTPFTPTTVWTIYTLFENLPINISNNGHPYIYAILPDVEKAVMVYAINDNGNNKILVNTLGTAYSQSDNIRCQLIVTTI